MQNKILVALITLLIVTIISVQQKSSVDAFQQWKIKNKPSWGLSEDYYRRAIFYKNVAMIEKHNADPTQTYKLTINQFAALTKQQFENIYLGAIPPSNIFDYEENQINLDADVDWTEQGKVTPVKNQGNCGSCWAFATVATVQSWALINKGKEVSLSEQQLVDCSGSYGNNGCNGGLQTNAFKYIQDKGISFSINYPYTARDGKCNRIGKADFNFNDYITVRGCDALIQALQVSPISVSVDASNWSFYQSGIFSNCNTNTNHAVLLVGVKQGNWKIKNSWGTGWGQQGYIRLAPGNTCGICIWPSPFVTD